MADRKMRVLIVDDANLVRLYDRQILEEAGFDVDEALNGLEALERLLVSRADALIVDINMPQMDGITFLAALKRQALPLSSIPALVASTESNLSDVVAARAAGANFYHVKPVSREDLARYHRFGLVNAEGNPTFVKFHRRPTIGSASVIWDEAVTINGADLDLHRLDFYEAIAKLVSTVVPKPCRRSIRR